MCLLLTAHTSPLTVTLPWSRVTSFIGVGADLTTRPSIGRDAKPSTDFEPEEALPDFFSGEVEDTPPCLACVVVDCPSGGILPPGKRTGVCKHYIRAVMGTLSGAYRSWRTIFCYSHCAVGKIAASCAGAFDP